MVGAITPWNVPLLLNLCKIGPALAAGCTVVLKPAPDTPWCGTTLGRLIAEQLARPGVQPVVAGRDASKGPAYARSLNAEFALCDATNAASLRETIAGAHLVVNASGPFQAKDYSIPQTCIEQGCHYIDLGDGREYVAGISQLDDSAKARGVFVCVGVQGTAGVWVGVAVDVAVGVSPG